MGEKSAGTVRSYGKAPSVSAIHAHAIIGKEPDRQDIVCRCQSCYDGITFRFKLV